MEPLEPNHILRILRRQLPSEPLSELSTLARHIHSQIVQGIFTAEDVLAELNAATSRVTLCEKFSFHVPGKVSRAPATSESVTQVTRQLGQLSIGSQAPPKSTKTPQKYQKTSSFSQSQPASPAKVNRPCKYFSTPSGCRKGKHCEFSHVSPDSSSSPARKAPQESQPTTLFVFKHAGVVQRWLQELEAVPDANDLLCRLLAFDSGKLDSFLKFGDWNQRRDILDQLLDSFLSIITRDDLRQHLNREQYAALFARLHAAKDLWEHLESFVQRSNTLHESRINKIISICESLLDLFSESYKTLSTLVESLEEKVEDSEFPATIVQRVDRLIQRRKDARKHVEKQREQQKDPRAVSSHDLVDEDFHLGFRDISVIPDGLSFLKDMPTHLLPNRIDGSSWKSLDDYLATFFHLLREDALRPLCDSLRLVADGGSFSSSHHSDVCVYDNVQVRAIDCARTGIVYRVSVSVRGRKNYDWSRSKRLLTGSLLAISSDGFRNEILWATVARRDPVTLQASGQIDLSFSFGAESALSQTDKVYVAVESKTYFEAYSHMLKALQGIQSLPFQDLLLSPVIPNYVIDVPSPERFLKKLNPPKYIANRPVLNFQCLDSSAKGGVNVLSPWRELDCSLDDSQLQSLKHALTNELSIIQGPPGTGKTFLGLKCVQIILDSFSQSELGPVLCVCYTNHALDQFLNGILKFETEVVRVGGRCEDAGLIGRSLNALSDELPRLSRDASRLRGQTMERLDQLTESIKRKLAGVSFEMLSLRQIRLAAPAAGQQLSAFGRHSGVIKMWLGVDKSPKKNDPAPQDGSLSSSPTDNVDAEDVEELEKAREVDIDDEEDVKDKKKPKKDSFMLLKRRATEDDDIVVVATSPAAVTASAAPSYTEFRLPDYYDENDLPKYDPDWEEADIWTLSLDQRRAMHLHWKNTITALNREELRNLSKEYTSACEMLKQMRYQSQIQILQKARVVGMTTTGAAKLRDMIQALKPRVVIVEEAAEVLEASIITSITPDTEHLILIGDHQQLRPSVATFKMEKQYHLDVSLFERLIRCGVPFTQLGMQRRMKTNIATMISPIYPRLRTHESVESYPPVKGVPQNLFFLTHNVLEDHPNKGDSQHSNRHESEFVAALAKYLVQQGYSALQITVLTPYSDQLMQLRQDIRRDATMAKIRITTIDNYQGEENDIVLLSLVRSNNVKSIGFLKTANRVCVALSRAKHGFYIVGNATLLASVSPFWGTVVDNLRRTSSVGTQLALQCSKHPQKVAHVSCARDFKTQAAEGGCTQPCGERLGCGHECTKLCHPYSHDSIKCWKPCARRHTKCGHLCTKICHEECGNCSIPLRKVLPRCGHEQDVPCHADLSTVKCAAPCQKMLSCGHQCDKLCGDSCQRKCRQTMSYTVPGCQHTIQVECWRLSANQIDGVNHPIDCTQKCGKSLICSHACEGTCCQSRGGCSPCSRLCENKCVHSKCGLSCGESCIPCREPCAWKCAHKECSRLCYEPCDRDVCNEPCQKRLKCGHQCIGLCGERCPTLCRVCDPTEIDAITRMSLSEYEWDDRFVQLDCGHCFEYTGIDAWLNACVTGAGTGAIRLPECPSCKAPVRCTMRYGAFIKKTLDQIEQVKPLILFKRFLEEAQQKFQNEEFTACMEFCLKSLNGRITVAAAHLFVTAAHRADLRLEGCSQLESLPAVSASHPVVLIARSMLHMGADNKRKAPLESAAALLMAQLRDGVQEEILDQNVFLAYAFYTLKQISKAQGILDKILQLKNDFQPAKKLKADIDALKQVVDLITRTESLQRGAWYQCRNGHLFVIGECGGAMERSVCPDCKAPVGGVQHRLDDSNSHAAVDGSSFAAWGDQANLANYQLDDL